MILKIPKVKPGDKNYKNGDAIWYWEVLFIWILNRNTSRQWWIWGQEGLDIPTGSLPLCNDIIGLHMKHV